MNKFPRRTLTGDPNIIQNLRQPLGWTQDDAAHRSGYSARLIRKIESEASVRPATLRDVLQCYHEALETQSWNIVNFLLAEEA